MSENRLSVAHIQVIVAAGTDIVREDKFVIGRISGHWFIGESDNFKCKRYLGKNDLEIIGSSKDVYVQYKTPYSNRQT